MRFSQLFCPTLKEAPKDADVISHQYMVRSGMIRKLGSGIYAYLPLGWRSMKKLSAIIEEEMNAIGGQETMMPHIVPADLLKRTGRWDKYGHLLLRMTDRHEKEFYFGPTHEESITDVVGSFIQSYKQLPITVYQIQNKFRDEFRPRFGLMRGREFVMKDAYSFHSNQACLDKTYDDMLEAYIRIFRRCGLSVKIVEADSGDIGGSGSAEFMVTAQTGEDMVVDCDHCEFASNIEAAAAHDFSDEPAPEITDKPMELVHTPGAARIADVAEFFKMSEAKTLKTLLYFADEEPIIVLIRGDLQLNEIKLKNLLKVTNLELMDDKTFTEVTGTVPGYAGPVNLRKKVRMLADHSVKSIGTLCVGANKEGYHYTNVVMGRDFDTPEFYDLRNVCEGELCQNCKTGNYRFVRGIEVGHIFKLGDIYSKAMNATYLNEQGKELAALMGCYGIGVGRTLAAAIEQRHDERGIQWPVSIAPYVVDILVVNPKDEALMQEGESLYEQCYAAGYDAVLDDRSATIGIKFKDADLIGFPVQVIIGKGFHNTGNIEIKWRETDEKFEVKPEEALAKIDELVRQEADKVLVGSHGS